jgi:hypothetical protein
MAVVIKYYMLIWIIIICIKMINFITNYNEVKYDLKIKKKKKSN